MNRFYAEALRIALRRMVGMLDRQLLTTDYDYSLTLYNHENQAVRSWGSLVGALCTLHREAFRELRAKAGVSLNKATWEWYNNIYNCSF